MKHYGKRIAALVLVLALLAALVPGFVPDAQAADDDTILTVYFQKDDETPTVAAKFTYEQLYAISESKLQAYAYAKAYTVGIWATQSYVTIDALLQAAGLSGLGQPGITVTPAGPMGPSVVDADYTDLFTPHYFYPDVTSYEDDSLANPWEVPPCVALSSKCGGIAAGSTTGKTAAAMAADCEYDGNLAFLYGALESEFAARAGGSYWGRHLYGGLVALYVRIDTEKVHRYVQTTFPACGSGEQAIYTCEFCSLTKTGDAASHVYSEDGFCTGCGTYNPEATAYTVRTAQNLAALSEAAALGDTLAGKTVALANDISLKDYADWKPLGGKATQIPLDVKSAADLDAAMEAYFLIFDNTGASYVRGSDKNGEYDPGRSYYRVESAPFAGSFDGQGHTVSDLSIRTGTSHLGLFGNVSGTVKNLTVSGSVYSDTTGDFIGGIAGKLSAGGLLEDCASYVTVDAPNAYNTGGITGFVGEMGRFPGDDNPMAIVRRCENFGAVSGKYRVAGIAGRNAGTITACANHGTIFNYSGLKRGTGGITGMNGVNNAATDAGIVEFCYNDGYINGNKGFWTGGLVGFQNARSVCRSSYNAGKLWAAETADGPLLSWVNPVVGQNEGTVADCLWLKEETGDRTATYIGSDPTGVGTLGGTSTNVQALSAAELKNLAAVTLLNGSSNAFQPSCGAYPVLSWQKATAHTEIVDAAVEPTCTQPGKTAGSHCSVCGAVLTGAKEIAPTGHREVVDAAVEPTCEGTGLSAGSHCAECGEVISAPVPTPAKGHDYVDSVLEATCLDGGATQHTCRVCGKIYYTDLVPAKGHDLETVTGAPATCTAAGLTDGVRCKTCQTWLVEQAEIPATGHTEVADAAVAATCTEAGKTEGSHCSVCNEILVAQTEVAALGHDYVETARVDATESAAGSVTYTCSRCHDSYTETIAEIACPSAAYNDVPAYGNWAHSGIDYCVAHSLMNGMSADRFDPNGTLTRAQLVTILYRVAGQPEPTTSGTFTDLTANWYKKAVEWAAANGIVKGYPDGTFRPDEAITREQIATILYRFDEASKADEDKLAGFPDAADVSGWAADGLNWAVNEGLINGVAFQGTSYLQPKTTATRDQIAAIIMRYLNSK